MHSLYRRHIKSTRILLGLYENPPLAKVPNLSRLVKNGKDSYGCDNSAETNADLVLQISLKCFIRKDVKVCMMMRLEDVNTAINNLMAAQNIMEMTEYVFSFPMSGNWNDQTEIQHFADQC